MIPEWNVLDCEKQSRKKHFNSEEFYVEKKGFENEWNNFLVFYYIGLPIIQFEKKKNYVSNPF